MPTGAELIAAERERQVEAEGWTAKHDDAHRRGEIPRAAVCYVLFNSPGLCHLAEKWWPWDLSWWKPANKDAVRNLTKAGALIAAEIDRLQRLTRQEPTDADR